jgi:hypothetical protein
MEHLINTCPQIFLRCNYFMALKIIFLFVKIFKGQALTTHSWNSSYSGGKDKEALSSNQPRHKVSKTSSQPTSTAWWHVPVMPGIRED